MTFMSLSTVQELVNLLILKCFSKKIISTNLYSTLLLITLKPEIDPCLFVLPQFNSQVINLQHYKGPSRFLPLRLPPSSTRVPKILNDLSKETAGRRTGSGVSRFGETVSCGEQTLALIKHTVFEYSICYLQTAISKT